MEETGKEPSEEALTREAGARVCFRFLSFSPQFVSSDLLARIRNGWRYSTQENVDKPGFPVLPNYVLFDMRGFDDVLFYDKYPFRIQNSFLIILRWLLL